VLLLHEYAPCTSHGHTTFLAIEEYRLSSACTFNVSNRQEKSCLAGDHAIIMTGYCGRDNRESGSHGFQEAIGLTFSFRN
jgi:hypothetical protein